MFRYKNKTLNYVNCYSSFIKDINTFNIITSKMSDDFVPHRINKNCMIWLLGDGILGEIECIFPEAITSPPIYNLKDVSVCHGVPLLAYEYSDTSTKAYIDESRFILVFDNSGIATMKFKQDNVIFYTNDCFILSIECFYSKEINNLYLH